MQSLRHGEAKTLVQKLYCSLIAPSMKQPRRGSFYFFTVSAYLFCVTPYMEVRR